MPVIRTTSILGVYSREPAGSRCSFCPIYRRYLVCQRSIADRNFLSVLYKTPFKSFKNVTFKVKKLTMSTPTEYRRKLPHIQPEEAVFFVTFNLRGAIPAHILSKLNKDYAAQKRNLLNTPKRKRKADEDYDEQINDILDSGKYGKHWLKEPAVAQIVANSFHFLDGRDFSLICYCVMSNHVHFVAYKLNKRLYKIMHSLKSYTAMECNKILNRSGPFWQREYFDRIVRDRTDLAIKIKYVINNPVKAGLVDLWDDYPFTYCRPEFLE